MDRRHFLQLSTVTTAITLLGAPGTRAQELVSRQKGEFRAWTVQGQPMPQKIMEQIFFLDLEDDPLPNLDRDAKAGHLWAELPDQPIAIAFNLSVQGFGQVKQYADNQGRGYRLSDLPLNLNVACAETRIYRVKEAMARWSRQGYTPSAEVQGYLDRAESKLSRASAEREEIIQALWANESLSESMWAGEKAVFEYSQHQISRQGKRVDFLFGANFFGHPSLGDNYSRPFRQLFNFGTLPFYWKSFEAQEGQPNYSRVDQSLHYLEKQGMTAKGHPLVWFHEAGVPDWIKKLSYSEVKEKVRQRVIDITRYYGDRIPFYDIINEAHDVPWADTLDYSAEQFLDLTRLASDAAQIGSPTVQRIVNCCCTWATYIPNSSKDNPAVSAYQYLKNCLAQDISFEIIGLQMYYPSQDMFEINRLLERFSTLGKTIHLTELGVSSSTERDEKSYFKTPTGLWHSPWSETVQADWIEQFYTLCYSKPYIEAITWWDFVDANFWPHGGLLKRDLTPKESYVRLSQVLDRWK